MEHEMKRFPAEGPKDSLPNFKTFDKVVVRHIHLTRWAAALYSHYEEADKVHIVCGGGFYNECLPYNDKTARLLGTTEDWKG